MTLPPDWCSRDRRLTSARIVSSSIIRRSPSAARKPARLGRLFGSEPANRLPADAAAPARVLPVTHRSPKNGTTASNAARGEGPFVPDATPQMRESKQLPLGFSSADRARSATLPARRSCQPVSSPTRPIASSAVPAAPATAINARGPRLRRCVSAAAIHRSERSPPRRRTARITRSGAANSAL